MKINLYLLFIFLSFSLKAQYRPQHSLYMLNNYLLNPAITGVENYTDIQTGYRQQWTHIEGMPRTIYFSIHGPIGLKPSQPLIPVHNAPESPYKNYVNKNRSAYHGFGASVFVDETGPFIRNEIDFSYAYHLQVAEKWMLSTGFSGGLIRQSLNPAKIITTQVQDPLISNRQLVEWQPLLTIGLFAHGSNWYTGLSGLQYLSHSGSGQEANKIFRQIYATFSIHNRLGNNIYAQPILLLRWDRSTTFSVDLGTRFIFLDKCWIGGFYRTTKEFVLQTGFHLNSFLSFGYSYDYGWSPLSGNQDGSHELVLIGRLWRKNGIPCPIATLLH